MAATAVETDRVGARVQLYDSGRRERTCIEKLDAIAAVGDQQAVRLRDQKNAVGRLESANAPEVLAAAQLEHLERAVILGREKQTIALKIDREVIEIPGVPRQLGATLQHQYRVSSRAARRRQPDSRRAGRCDAHRAQQYEPKTKTLHAALLTRTFRVPPGLTPAAGSSGGRAKQALCIRNLLFQLLADLLGLRV